MEKYSLNYAQVIARAKKLLPSFRIAIANIPYEAKGILSSELLFVRACMPEDFMGRILESGRARGQSTLVLAVTAPQTRIISIEYDEHSPDVPVATERLRDRGNVKLVYGDSRALLPAMIENGDVVLIDGPKMFRAVRLALRVLASKKVGLVFLHDVHTGTEERAFLDRFFPEALFSDYRGFAEVAGVLDNNIQELLPAKWRLSDFEGEYGYGYTLGCLPFTSRSYRWLIVRAILYDVRARFARRYAWLRHRPLSKPSLVQQ